MRLWERLTGRETRTSMPLSLDEWAEMFTFGGQNYPLVQTTMGTQDEERVGLDHSAAYRGNGPVFALTLARMQVFSQARFQWTRFEKGQASDLFGTPELGVLERPWPGGTTSDLLARMELDVTRAGNAFVRRTTTSRLNVLRPEWVTIVLGSNEDVEDPAEASDVEVVGYIYTPPTGRGKVFTPDQVAHYAPIPDPDATFLGMSWITPVLRDVQGDNATVVHKDRFMRNAATPNLAIKFDPSTEYHKVVQFKELLEAEHKGAWNAYKTLYLGGGADAHVIGKDFKELDFAATQGKGESRLASAAGVPPSWVGFSEGLQGSSLNAGNFNSARRRYGDGTMQHLWTNVSSSLQTIVRPPANSSLWFDTRGMAFLREDAKDASEILHRQAETITALVRDGFTAESAIDAITNEDWSRLKHTGLVSVQMQEPGAEKQPKAAQNGATNASG